MDIHQTLERLQELSLRERGGEDVSADLAVVRKQLDHLKTHRSGSRFPGPGASADVLDHIASGGSVGAGGALLDAAGKQVGSLTAIPGSPVSGGDLKQANAFLTDLVNAKGGRSTELLAKMLTEGTKDWTEGSPTGGGYLVAEDILPGYLPKRRAAGPLRDRMAQRKTTSDQVAVTVENGTVTVAHVAEGATIPTSTGSVGQLVSTVFKLAGASNLSTELLEDSEGNAGELVAQQFGAQVGIAADLDLIQGSGTGQPKGVLNAEGVAKTKLADAAGKTIYEGVRKAISRLAGRFWTADTVAILESDQLAVDLATDSNGNYMFPDGLAGKLTPGMVVTDPNLPINLGAGTNESLIIVGDAKNGGLFIERDPLRVEASPHASWLADEVTFRARQRYGFTVTRSECWELLTVPH